MFSNPYYKITFSIIDIRSSYIKEVKHIKLAEVIMKTRKLSSLTRSIDLDYPTNRAIVLPASLTPSLFSSRTDISSDWF